MGRVSGKSIIVTGSGSGIGEGFAKVFGAEGAKVGVCDVNTAAAERVAKAINDKGGQAFAFTADVSNREQVRAGFKKYVDWAGSLDVIFNNAGFN
jgi:NAD(P)-dependent dehydrogenase (short-subunit alcohol dehydrogenase family)